MLLKIVTKKLGGSNCEETPIENLKKRPCQRDIGKTYVRCSSCNSIPLNLILLYFLPVAIGP